MKIDKAIEMMQAFRDTFAAACANELKAKRARRKKPVKKAVVA